MELPDSLKSGFHENRWIIFLPPENYQILQTKPEKCLEKSHERIRLEQFQPSWNFGGGKLTKSFKTRHGTENEAADLQIPNQ